jgi:hypothetical protein
MIYIIIYHENKICNLQIRQSATNKRWLNGGHDDFDTFSNA